MKMTQTELNEIVAEHGKWLEGTGGKRADLTRADLIRADLTRADLTGAKLSESKLSEANMSRADLSGASLSWASLSGSYLFRADLSGADLSRSTLSRATLSDADLSGADLSGADLTGAILTEANLTRANLSEADLTGANLTGAKLTGAKLDPVQIAQLSIVPEAGPFWGWKKVRTDTGTAIVRLLIPDGAPRSNATGRKCRAGWAVVLEGEGVSGHAPETKYAPGLTVRAHEWCTDRWQECAGGIHFFITRAEAEAYDL